MNGVAVALLGAHIHFDVLVRLPQNLASEAAVAFLSAHTDLLKNMAPRRGIEPLNTLGLWVHAGTLKLVYTSHGRQVL